MDDSSNGRAVALYPANPGSNPRSGSVWVIDTKTRPVNLFQLYKIVHFEPYFTPLKWQSSSFYITDQYWHY